MTAGETHEYWNDRDAPYPQLRGNGLVPIERGRHPWVTESSVTSQRRSRSWWTRAVRHRKDLTIGQETLLLLGVAFFFAVLVRTFAFQAFYIPSGSMESTLNVGDRVLVNKIVYDFRQPKRGEIVVFHGTSTWAPESAPDTDTSFFSRVGSRLGDLIGISEPGRKDFIKRIVGLPGDTVACCDVAGHVTVNGQPLIESYVVNDASLDSAKGAPPCSTRPFPPVVVRPGNMFVMGDNRIISLDSRCQGQVPLGNIIGRAIAIVWSPGRWASLSVPSTFADVPKPYTLGPVGPVSIDPGTGIASAGTAVGAAGPAGTAPDGATGVPAAVALALSARTLRRLRFRRRRLRA